MVWAYDLHLADLYREGKTVAEIQAIAREEWHCHWSQGTISAVLRASGLKPADRGRAEL